MKGFPNQIADLEKLAQGLRCVIEVRDAGDDPRDDRVLGEALVRAGVLGTGHGRAAKPVDEYLKEQRKKPRANQAFQTSARGLRELYRYLGLIDESGPALVVTADGRQAAAFAGNPIDPTQIQFWRRVIMSMRHEGGGGSSHPYQIMLRLVGRRPGILRAKCALALEALDDSEKQLDRIVKLSALTEDEIRAKIHVTESNWDNAKKVLPSFAEQLADVIRDKQGRFWLADAPGRADAGAVEPTPKPKGRGAPSTPRRPRTSRVVTPDTIASAGIAERDEPPVPPDLDPIAAAAAIALRKDRVRRHNAIVRALAVRLAEAGMTLSADPFDALGEIPGVAILAEIKSLDGTAPDERAQVMAALAQLLYYEAFLRSPLHGETLYKVACFEHKITTEHQAFLNGLGIATTWHLGDGRFGGDELAARTLGAYLEELR